MSLRRTGLICVVLAMFSIAGGPCAVLQTVAWAEMLRDYCQRSGSVAMAVEQTFDGKHPCDLCRKVASVKSQEKQQVPTKSASHADAKVKALCGSETPCLRFPEEENVVYPAWIFRCVCRFEAPPAPPPRGGSSTA